MGTGGKVLFLLLGLVCVSCAGPSIETRNSAYSPTIGERIGQVVRQPFMDFDLSEPKIPPILARAASAPYALPARTDCASLRTEVQTITNVLGPDIGSARLDSKGNIVADGSAAAWGMARGAVEGWIPFHGVVREFSGAAHHDRLLARAVLSGFVRRAYLRGLMETHCR